MKVQNNIISKIINLLSAIAVTDDELMAEAKILELNHIILESDEETGIEELDDYLLFLGMDLEHYERNPKYRAEIRLLYGIVELKIKVRDAQKKVSDILSKYGCYLEDK